jgi:integrase
VQKGEPILERDDHSEETQILVPSSPLSLAEVGRLADEFTAQATFARYQERQALDTLRQHRASLALFRIYLQAIPHLAVVGDLYTNPTAWTGMTKGLVEGFVQWQLAKGYAIGSVNMRLSTVRLYARLAQGAGVLDENQAAMIRTVQGYRGREGRRIDAQREVTRLGAKKAQWTQLTIVQAHELLNQPDTPQGRRDKLLLCLLLYHGLRCGEVVLLQVESFNRERGVVHFEQPKTGKELRHQLHLQTYLAFQRYLDLDHPTKTGSLLVGSRKGGQLTGGMSKSAINQRIGALAKRMNVTHLTLSPHDLRHFWATSAARAETDLEALKQAGGWASLEMPLRYIKEREIANERVKLAH